MPSLGIAGDTSIISLVFSSNVNRPNRSSARCSAVKFGFWYGSICAIIADVVNVNRVVKNSFFMLVVFVLFDDDFLSVMDVDTLRWIRYTDTLHVVEITILLLSIFDTANARCCCYMHCYLIA